MHQTKKGNEWHFGMKAHIGVDAVSGLVHSMVGTSANVSDISQAANLLHGDENSVHADAGYLGLEKRNEMIITLTNRGWLIPKRRWICSVSVSG